MSDDRPMRHEEYLAMAEQNRRLFAENNTLKAKQDKKMKSHGIKLSRFKEIAALCATPLLVITGILGVIFLIVWLPLRADALDGKEKNGPVQCYILGQAQDASDPWSPWLLWRARNGRNQQWHELVEGINTIFSTRDAGVEFAKAYNIKLCK